MQQAPSTTNDLENLAGVVDQVTFHNEEIGFCVLLVKARGQRDPLTVAGHAATIGAGEFVQASGRWFNDRTHGVQFRAAFLRAAPPTTAEGIEKYLASGMIKGIGPRQEAGEGFPRTGLRHHRAEARAPEGGRRHRAEARHSIVAAWADQKAIREIMIFLHSHGVGTSRAVGASSRPTAPTPSG